MEGVDGEGGRISVLVDSLFKAAPGCNLDSSLVKPDRFGFGFLDLIVRETIVCHAWFAGYCSFLRKNLVQTELNQLVRNTMLTSHLDTDSSESQGLDISQHHLLGHCHLGAKSLCHLLRQSTL